MWIEVKNIYTNKMTCDCTINKKNLYTFKWKKLIPEDCTLISEKLFFSLNLKIQYKKNKTNNKIILIGQYNNKFWFFKIIKDSHKYSYKFSIKKPLLEKINDLKISILDWYHVIHKIEPEKLEIEYAISKDI